MDKNTGQGIENDDSGHLSVSFTKHSERRVDSYGRRPQNRRRRSGDVASDSTGSSIWLISFTDIMALMLTFFVLQFSMATPSKSDWAEVTSALQQEFSKYYGATQSAGLQDAVSIKHINYNSALSVRYLATMIQNVIDQNDELYQVDLILKKDRLILSLPHELLFDDVRSNKINKKAVQVVSLLGESLSSIRNKIEVVGFVHPEDLAEDMTEGSPAWQLSASFAAQVAAILQASGYRRDIGIRGGGIGRYVDMSYSGSSGGMRDTMARRVNIVILNHDGRRSKVF